MLLDQLDELGAQLRIGHGLVALDDQIALARNRSGSELAAAMPVGIGKADEGRTRHFKASEYTVIDKRDALRGNAFIIELVKAEKILRAKLSSGSVVHDAEEAREDRFADFFSEGLTFGRIFLTMALGAMAENFMKEHGSGAACEQGRSDRGIVDGSRYEAFEFLAHGPLRSKHGFIVGGIAGIDPIEIVITVDVHAVGSFALDEKLEAVADLAVLQLRAFAGHLIDVLRLRGEGDDGIDDGGGVAEGAGIGADFFFPRLAVQGKGNRSADVVLGFFVGEIGRAIFFGVDLLSRPACGTFIFPVLA